MMKIAYMCMCAFVWQGDGCRPGDAVNLRVTDRKSVVDRLHKSDQH